MDEKFIQCHTFVSPIRTYPSGSRAHAHIWALFRCPLDDSAVQTENLCVSDSPARRDRHNECVQIAKHYARLVNSFLIASLPGTAKKILIICVPRDWRLQKSVRKGISRGPTVCKVASVAKSIDRPICISILIMYGAPGAKRDR